MLDVREIEIRFVGLFDTVVSYKASQIVKLGGLLENWLVKQKTINLPKVKKVVHLASAEEHRDMNARFLRPHVIERPCMKCPQSAIVIGPTCEEIHIDEYGRIKVQFIWDREGKKNEDTSCYLRVMRSTEYTSTTRSASAWVQKAPGATACSSIGCGNP